MSVMPPSPFLELPSSDGRRDEIAHPVEATVEPLRCSERPKDTASDQQPREGVAFLPSEAILPPLPGLQISNAGDELDEDRFMAEIEEPPAFITVPSQGYLLACERDQTEAILEFMLR